MAETAGTTNKKALRKLSGRFGLGMKLSPSAEHAQDSYALVGDFLSRDPYGLMYPAGMIRSWPPSCGRWR